MRAITDRDNLHAELARHRKAIALADSIAENYDLDDAVIERLPSQSDEWWKSLAKACEVNPPSPAAVLLVCDLLRRRLNARDPFANIAPIRDAGGTWGQ